MRKTGSGYGRQATVVHAKSERGLQRSLTRAMAKLGKNTASSVSLTRISQEKILLTIWVEEKSLSALLPIDWLSQVKGSSYVSHLIGNVSNENLIPATIGETVSLPHTTAKCTLCNTPFTESAMKLVTKKTALFICRFCGHYVIYVNGEH